MAGIGYQFRDDQGQRKGKIDRQIDIFRLDLQDATRSDDAETVAQRGTDFPDITSHRHAVRSAGREEQIVNPGHRADAHAGGLERPGKGRIGYPIGLKANQAGHQLQAVTNPMIDFAN
jgi:hypothetical protein